MTDRTTSTLGYQRSTNPRLDAFRDRVRRLRAAAELQGIGGPNVVIPVDEVEPLVEYLEQQRLEALEAFFEEVEK